MRAARQQHGGIDFTAINWIHVPVALLSILLVAAMLARDVGRRRLDDLTLLAGTVFLALLGNAFVCGVISGPHDRYGARMTWIATFAVLIAALKQFTDADRSSDSPLL
jgi:cytochrome c biogenesis factor